MLSTFARSFVTDAAGNLKNTVYGIQIMGRMQHAVEVQKVLSQHGCEISSRLGLHHTDERYCAPHGLLLCQMSGHEADIHKFETDLSRVQGVQIQKMEFKL